MFLPLPGRFQRVVHTALGLPSQLLLGKGRIGPYSHHVATPSGSEFPIEFQIVDLLEAVDELKYRNGTAGAYVEDFVTLLHLLIYHPTHCADVGLCKVNYVDIVPQAGAVRGRVVVAEHRQALSLAYRGLGDERYKIVGHSPGQLTYQR